MTGSVVVPPGLAVPGTAPGGALRRHGRRLRYLVLGLPLSIAAFVVAVAGFTAGAATVVVWIGVPILAVTLRAARGLATVERRSTERALGAPLPPHHYREPGGRWIARLAEPQSWRDLLHAVVSFPVRLVGFIVAVVWTVTGLGATLYILWEWALPRERGDYNGLFELLTGSDSRIGDIVLTTGIGLVLLATLPWVLAGLVAARASLARGLLTNQTAALRALATRRPDRPDRRHPAGGHRRVVTEGA